MKNHDWIAGVLEDLKTYAELHDLKEMIDALTTAAAAAESLVRKAPAASVMMRFASATV